MSSSSHRQHRRIAMKPIIKLVSRMRQKTFAFGFLTGVGLFCSWYIIFMNILASSLEVDVGRRSSSGVDPHSVTLQWQAVGEDQAYVLSAYLDRRAQETVVRVIGIEKLNQGPRLCLLWMPWREDPEVVQVMSKVVPENHNKEYWVKIYSCAIKDKVPLAVSLVYDVTKSPDNILPIQDTQSVENKVLIPQSEFTVCVTMVHSNYDNFQQVIETIELNRMFGAQKIVIYDYSIGPYVLTYLKHYVKEGVVDLIKYTLPVGQDEIHYFGQLATVNDCVYRYMHRTKFLVFSDFDEIFVPRKFPNWPETMNKLVYNTSTHAHWSAAFVLRNAFFPLDCENAAVMRDYPLLTQYNLKSLLKTIRLSMVWPHLSRSKCILRPKFVTVAGVHYMWGFTGNYTHYNVTKNTALLHHYRHFMDGCKNWEDDSFMWTQDKFLWKFRREITKRVWGIMTSVDHCPYKHRPSQTILEKLFRRFVRK